VHPGGFLLLPEPWGKFGDDNLDDIVGFVNGWFASGQPEVRKLHRQLCDGSLAPAASSAAAGLGGGGG
jgi:hypothetical protein